MAFSIPWAPLSQAVTGWTQADLQVLPRGTMWLYPPKSQLLKPQAPG